MRIAVVIPSRFGSSRFEGKPLALIAGKPMIQHVYERASRAKNITDIVVATDDNRISDVVKGFGGEVVMTSDDIRSGTDRVAAVADAMGLDDDDIVINVQGDQPLLDYRTIDELVSPLIDDKSIEMSTLAYKIIKEEELSNPKDVKVTFDNNGFALYFSRSKIPYGRDTSDYDVYKHLGFYAYTKRFIDIFKDLPEGRLENLEKLEQLRVLEFGYKMKIIITRYDSPEVDLPEDIVMVEKILQNS